MRTLPLFRVSRYTLHAAKRTRIHPNHRLTSFSFVTRQRIRPTRIPISITHKHTHYRPHLNYRRFSSTSEESERGFVSSLFRYIGYGLMLYSPFVAYKFVSKPLKLPPQEIAADEQPFLSKFLTQLPNRAMSRFFGRVMEKEIPMGLRKLLFELFGVIYTVKWDEYEHDLTKFKSPQEFFTRPLAHARYVSQAQFVCPVDGTFVIGGKVDEENGQMDQIKGMSYKLDAFLGESPLKKDRLNNLYYAVMYLSPGDYHRFHSATDCSFSKVHHFSADLFCVAPWLLKIVPGLFSLNERIVLTGTWGDDDLFYAYVPVGAYNCGSIELEFDADLVTNKAYQDDAAESYGRNLKSQHGEECVAYYENEKKKVPLPYQRGFEFEYDEPIIATKGEELGLFKLGSTVVMVFEAPSFKFRPRRGDQIRFGQKLGDLV